MAIAYGVTDQGRERSDRPDAAGGTADRRRQLANAVQINVAFWLENIDRLTERFNKWAAIK